MAALSPVRPRHPSFFMSAPPVRGAAGYLVGGEGGSAALSTLQKSHGAAEIAACGMSCAEVRAARSCSTQFATGHIT